MVSHVDVLVWDMVYIKVVSNLAVCKVNRAVMRNKWVTIDGLFADLLDIKKKIQQKYCSKTFSQSTRTVLCMLMNKQIKKLWSNNTTMYRDDVFGTSIYVWTFMTKNEYHNQKLRPITTTSSKFTSWRYTAAESRLSR